MTETFVCNDIQFTNKGVPFDPLHDKDLTIISLDASLSSDLDWKDAQSQAAASKMILWDLDFGLSAISFDQSAVLASFLLAIEEFTKTLLIPYQERSFGVCLYQGQLLTSFKWNLNHEAAYLEWKQNYAAFPYPKKLYCIEIFSEYLHKLAAALPEETFPIALFDSTEKSEAQLAQLLSREHFSYLYVGLKNHSLPFGPFSLDARKAQVGLVLPLHAYCSYKCLNLIDACINELKKNNILFRIISESYLTESWDGLDLLILFSNFLSPQGKRKAQGFLAAGGELVIQGKSMGIGEVSWDEFRGRGI